MHIPPKATPPPSSLTLVKQYHQQAQDLLTQSREMHDLTMSNQRKLVFALSHLLPKKLLAEYGFNSDYSSAEGVDNNVHAVNIAMEHRDIYDVIHAINVLALSNADVVQVFVDIDGNLQSVDVWAVDISTDWSDKESNKDRLLDEIVYLRHKPNPLKKLLSIESQLTELIIEAREQAEAKAEVNA
ncbi:hypothetical protein KW488_20935 [Vibrio fluvialis]|nr:hypothetical protein [Vibrio fluvialis]